LNGRAQSDVGAAVRSSLISGNPAKILGTGATKKVHFFIRLSARDNGPGKSENPGVASPRWKESLGERRFFLFDRAVPPPLASPEFVAILGTCLQA
jgi:hypothetical protein